MLAELAVHPLVQGVFSQNSNASFAWKMYATYQLEGQRLDQSWT